MEDDNEQRASAAKPEDATPTPSTRADAYRERFRQAQAIAAQVARARAAGGLPTESEAARLVAEFHARGGRVTVCAPPDDVQREEQARNSKASKRARS